ncbi:MAG: Anti-sigma F factor [Firmicutes bacterium ADurb.Bin248]|nr:MAG: Anti-sigma F factor [Firmicutes bacterium ADurb.Bin248]HOG00972.1 anti-sigma F factor [Clostridia bacterium]HPK15504.1 anti-sigma F factor [Clostridia bacterium]
MKNNLNASFSAISQNESLARTIAAAFAAQLNPTIEELTDIRTAVSEAVTNAIIHGYSNRGGTVTMNCSVEGSVFSVDVIDTGRGIDDIELAMQPFYTSAPELERSGMGFSVMQAFMDEVKVRSMPGYGTTVSMKKRVSAVRDDG